MSGSGRVNNGPPLHPIPVQRAFQIVGLDVMDLPKTESGNKHVVVFQDYLTKWPFVFPVPDQKAVRIAEFLAEEVVPVFGVLESLLTDSGTDLLSHLMKDMCSLLGTKKLNTTANHPQCDGMVERTHAQSLLEKNQLNKDDMVSWAGFCVINLPSCYRQPCISSMLPIFQHKASTCPVPCHLSKLLLSI